MFLAVTLVLLVAASDDSSLRGLDPVELCEGRETPGRETDAIERDGRRYLFATDANRARFEAEPERFAVQMDGGCGRMGPLSGSCSDDRFVVHAGRIYLFASEACRATFEKTPSIFIDRDDPPLFEGAPDKEAVARGRALLARALDGLGGAARVDATRALRLEKRGVETRGGQQHTLRDTRTWRLPDDLRRETAEDEWVYAYVVTAADAYSGGKNLEPLSPAARRELRRQMGREPLWLLRQRDQAGFTVAADGTEVVGAITAERLRIHFEGATTTFCIDPVTGRILRASWRGRLEIGAIGAVVVERSDFREAGGLMLPHACEVRFDGGLVEALSGSLDVAVDPELDASQFSRG